MFERDIAVIQIYNSVTDSPVENVNKYNWSLTHAYIKSYFARVGCVMVICVKSGIDDLCSNSWLVYFIHFYTNAFVKGLNQFLLAAMDI